MGSAVELAKRAKRFFVTFELAIHGSPQPPSWNDFWPNPFPSDQTDDFQIGKDLVWLSLLRAADSSSRCSLAARSGYWRLAAEMVPLQSFERSRFGLV